MAGAENGLGAGRGGTMTSIRFDADLELSIDGITVRVTGEDDVLVVTTPRWLPIAYRLQRVAGPRPRLRTIAAELANAGATVRLDTEAGPLLCLGAGAEPSRFDRVFGFRHLRTASPTVLWRHSWAVRTAAISTLALAAVLWAPRRRQR
jgi:hypothetical protein